MEDGALALAASWPSTNATSASSAAASPPRCSSSASRSSGPGLRITVGRSGPIDLRSRESRQLPSPRARVRRTSLARRLHRGSAGQGHDLDDDGGRRAGAALGRRVQPIFRGGSAAEVDVRPGRRLADRVGRAGAVLRRGRAAAERRRRSESVSGGSRGRRRIRSRRCRCRTTCRC